MPKPSCHFLATQAHGKTLEEFVNQHQDKSRNALSKSHEAAFNAWVEELKADQAQFLSEKILYPGSISNTPLLDC